MNKNTKEKVRAMTVSYTVGNGLYVNVTNACTNSCDFCIRNNGDGAYGSDSLWLSHEPSYDEILTSILSHNLKDYAELVFCGYGEPACRLDTVRKVALRVKQLFPDIKIRINTNGQSDLIMKCNSAPVFEGAFDSVSISLNAPTREKYQAICHSVYGERAFDAMLTFAKNVKEYVPEVMFSVVREFLTEEELSLSAELAAECGISLRIRDYIS